MWDEVSWDGWDLRDSFSADLGRMLEDFLPIKPWNLQPLQSSTTFEPRSFLFLFCLLSCFLNYDGSPGPWFAFFSSGQNAFSNKS